MKAKNFDELTKALANSTSRRHALRIITTASLGGLFGLVGIRSVFGINRNCAKWCAQVFGPNTSAAGRCTSDAAHNTGLCAQCGNKPPSSICCVRNTSGYCNGTSAATCCGSSQHCCNGTCNQCCANTDCTHGNTCGSSHTCVCGSGPACTGSTTCISGSCCPNGQVCGNTCCSSGQTCNSGTCCIANAGHCTSDAQCCSGICDESANGGTCVSCIPSGDATCNGDSECCTGNTCLNGACCPSANVCGSVCCASSQTCLSGQCVCSGVPSTTLCTGDADCSALGINFSCCNPTMGIGTGFCYAPCGNNNCGGTCGTCDVSQCETCENGTCVGCPPGQSCSNGTCVCVPNCAGKACGDDGCGGTCGTCDVSQCETCENGTCVGCPPGQSCSNGQCVCAPNCTSTHNCGSDGCGGSCGTCSSGQICFNDDHCVAGGGGGGCFVAGTPIVMAGGYHKFIDTIQVGDTILAWHEDTRQIFPTTVVEALHHEETMQTLFDIELEDRRKFTVNDNHPMYVAEDERFIVSRELPGRFGNGKPTTFLGNNNEPVKLVSLRMRTERCKVYNLHVEGQGEKGHTYFANGILVHNKINGAPIHRPPG